MLRISFEINGETRREYSLEENDYNIINDTATSTSYFYDGVEHVYLFDGEKLNVCRNYIDNPDTRNFIYGGVASSSDTILICVDTAGETSMVYHSGIVSLTTLGTTETSLSTFIYVQPTLSDRSLCYILSGVE